MTSEGSFHNHFDLPSNQDDKSGKYQKKLSVALSLSLPVPSRASDQAIWGQSISDVLTYVGSKADDSKVMKYIISCMVVTVAGGGGQ